MSVDRLIALAQQRTAIEQFNAERRLKERLREDAAALAARARAVAATTMLRALSEAVGQASGPSEHRPCRVIHEAVRPHPNSAGRKPLRTNWPLEDHPRVLPGGLRISKEV